YNALREELLDTFKPKSIEVTGEGTPTTTGWFEVQVDGKLIHSKKNGDGYVEPGKKMQKIINAIHAAM
ncbi:unnamed protein product, partial [Lymnaea stagnalis]